MFAHFIFCRIFGPVLVYFTVDIFQVSVKFGRTTFGFCDGPALWFGSFYRYVEGEDGSAFWDDYPMDSWERANAGGEVDF